MRFDYVDAPARHGIPLVSVGLPVYNGAPFLARALDSLLSQDWPNVDILVSDNASTDESANIAESYAARDSRVRVIRAAVNAGMEANFARVLDSARGIYFMWAASDDWWDSRFITRMVGALQGTPGAIVAMSALDRVDESDRVIGRLRLFGRDDPSRMSAWKLSMLLAGGRPYHLFLYGLYRTEFIKRAFTGFAPVVASDRLFMCRIAMAGRFAYVDETLHRRMIRAKPLEERYAGEPLGQMWRGAWARWRLALAAGPYLWSSPVLPSTRRLWVPLMVLRFLKASAGHTIVRTARASGLLRSAVTRGSRNHD